MLQLERDERKGYIVKQMGEKEDVRDAKREFWAWGFVCFVLGVVAVIIISMGLY